MKTFRHAWLVFVLTSFSPFALADMQLLQRNNCLACHYIDKQKYGPNFTEIAERYAGKTGSSERLAQKIKTGGTGVWGQDLMPPQPQVSDADALMLANFILGLKKN